MFPEIASRVKNLLGGFGSKPIALDLKTDGYSFSAADYIDHRKFPQLLSLMSGGMQAWSGEAVSIASALNHSVVWACNRLISETVASLPCYMMQVKGTAKRVATEHPMYAALHDEPNAEMDATTFRELGTSHTLLAGNGYSQIIRRSGTGTAIELIPLIPESVNPDREKAGQKRLVYLVKDGNSAEKTYTVQKGKPQDILHLRGIGWDGIKGYSVIAMARQSVGTAQSAERNVARFYAMGGRLPYVLEMAQKFKNKTDFDQFRADWESVYSDPHRAPILENDIKYKQIGLNMEDAQMLGTRLFTIHEICRWFAVSPHLVGDLSRATFSNIEQLAMEFAKLTLSIHLNRWERALRRCVLTDQEKADGYFWKHNIDALLRGDFASRMSGYSTMLQNGVFSINEIRDMEDQNPIDGGDEHHIQLNMQALPGDNQTTARGSALIRVGSEAGRSVPEAKAKELPPPAVVNLNISPPNVNVITPPVSVFNGSSASEEIEIERNEKGLMKKIKKRLEPARLEFASKDDARS
jgi:HK97 family phage portal protein